MKLTRLNLSQVHELQMVWIPSRYIRNRVILITECGNVNVSFDKQLQIHAQSALHYNNMHFWAKYKGSSTPLFLLLHGLSLRANYTDRATAVN
jgi:hypothetical protein